MRPRWIQAAARSSAARWLAAIAGLALLVALYRQWAGVSPATVALTLLLYILLLATGWGLRFAVVVSVLATACYNFFFLPPVGTFTISDPQNWIALVVFLAVSVAASRLSARIRDEASTARAREREVRILYTLGRALLETEQLAGEPDSLPAIVTLSCHARSVGLFLLEGERFFTSPGDPVVAPGTGQLRELSQQPAATLVAGGPVDSSYAVPLRVGAAPRGVLLVTAGPISLETLEAIGGLLSIALDRAAALAEATRSEAEKAREQLRSIMLDSITHELRTPLTGIKASVSALLLPAAQLGPEQHHELLTVIDEECDRLNRLVAQSLEMARLDANQVRMHRREASVRGIVERALESSAQALHSHRVRVLLPAQDEALHADPEWIERVLCHLLENAAKYAGAGTTIEVASERLGDSVAIEVRDQGPGVQPGERGRIFEKFYRGGTHRQTIPGTGMGLAICRSIVEAHAGSLTVHQAAGGGSVFRLTLRAFPGGAPR